MGWLRRLSGGEQETAPGGDSIHRHDAARPRPMGLPDVPPECTQQREAFYRAHFGEPQCVLHEVHGMQPHIDVYACAPSEALGRDYYTFVTSGMSDLPMNLTDIPRKQRAGLGRAELLTYVSEADWQAWHLGNFPHGWLRWLAEAVHEWETYFAPTHTVPNGGDPPAPLLPGSLMTTAFFLEAIHEPEEVRHGLRLGDEPVNLLWMALITNAECDYKLQNGAEALIELLEEHSLPQCVDMSRQSYV
jgi:hypothetical protein